MFETFAKIQKAVISARARTGDKTIGTRVEKGKYQVVRVSYAANGISSVTTCSEFVSADDVVKLIDSIQ